MSTPQLRKVDNGYFYAFWSEGRRSRRKSMGTKDRSTAENRLAEWILLDGHRGGPSEENDTPCTVSDCWTVYRAKHVDIECANTKSFDFAWASLEPHFGDMAIPAVGQGACDAYVALRTSGRLGRVVKPVTCRKELAALFAALRFCAAKPQSMFSPKLIETVKLPPDAEPRDRWLRTHEIQKLLAAAARLRRGSKLSRIERFLWVALETAARKQAILDLTWDRVDFDTNTIHFDVPGRRQTKKRRPAVPISKSLRPVLLRAYEERENDLVVTNKGAVWASMQLVVTEAGLGGEKPKGKDKPKATGVSPHVLRHTAATHMARRGVPLWKIAKILGNSLAMVEKVYAKWAPEDPEGTVDMISNGSLTFED